MIAAHDQARDAVRAAPVKNADETGWKQAGARRWLWTAATTTVADFVIHIHRGARGLKELLGEAADPLDGGADVRLAGRCRRLSKDREKSVMSSEVFVKLAMIQLMLNRLEPKETEPDFHYREAA